MCLALAAPAAAQSRSLAEFAPQNVGFFLEFAGLGESLGPWRLHGLYALLEEFGRAAPAGGPSVAEWRASVEGLLDMPIEAAVSALLGKQVAVIASDFTRLEAGVLVARVADLESVDVLIDRLRRQGQIREDRALVTVRRFRSGDRVWLGRMDDVLIISLSPGGSSLFDEVVQLVAGLRDDTLGGSARFRSECQQLPKGYRGLLYVDADDAANRAASTAVKLPGLVPMRRAVAGMYGNATGLDLEVRGLLARPGPRHAAERTSPDLLAMLPHETLFAYATTVNFPREVGRIVDGRNPGLQVYLRLYQALSGQREIDPRVLEALGPNTAVVIGHTERDASSRESVAWPTVSLLIEAKDEAVVNKAVQHATVGLVTALNVMSIREDRRVRLRVDRLEHGSVSIFRINLRGFLQPLNDCVYFHTLEFAWAVANGWLIVSTHAEHIPKLLDALQREKPPSGTFVHRPLESPVLRACTGEVAGRPSTLIVLQSALSARIVQSWIRYIETQHPQMLEPGWWRNVLYGQGGERVTLGVGLSNVPRHPGKLDITTVLPGWPAAGQLRVGDRVLAVDGRVLDAEDPRRDFNRAVRSRKNPRQVMLRIERSERTLDVQIALPADSASPESFDPIGTLRHVTRFAAHFSSVAYSDWHSSPDRVGARIVFTFADQDAAASR